MGGVAGALAPRARAFAACYLERMDARLTKGLTVLGAIAIYVLADRVLGADSATYAREAAAMLLGWVGLRRPGDEPPAPPAIGSWAP